MTSSLLYEYARYFSLNGEMLHCKFEQVEEVVVEVKEKETPPPQPPPPSPPFPPIVQTHSGVAHTLESL